MKPALYKGGRALGAPALAILLSISCFSPRAASADDRSMSASAHPSMAFVYPIMGPEVSSDYGMRVHPIRRLLKHHDGIDLAVPEGTPIRSIAEGIVVYADPHGGYGQFIAVRHRDGYTSHYGHCRSLHVSPGQRVKAGEIIGTVGSTGLSTGPHLHFEVRVNGEPKDPQDILPGLSEHSAG